MFGLFAGTAYADHHHGGRGPVVRDHRGPTRTVVVHDHRAPQGGVVVHERRGHHEHVRVVNGRYAFPGGVVRVYHRPHFREHYYNVHVRPAVVVEHYDPVPGYVWVAGNWSWSGREWIWNDGYWAPDEPAPPPPAPVVQGGVGIHIGGGISIH
jgi:hypothetical protein